MANISVGFRRLGVVFATVPAVIGVAMICYWAYLRLSTQDGPWTKYSEPNVYLYIGLGWLLGSAFLYVLTWAISWVVQGFNQKAS